MKEDISSVEWRHEDELPKDMTDLEYDLVYPFSKIENGVRVFAFIDVYDDNGDFIKTVYLGA